MSRSCTTPLKILEDCDIEEEFEKELQSAEDFVFSIDDHSDTETEETSQSKMVKEKSMFSDSEDEASKNGNSSSRKRNLEDNDVSSSDARPSKIQKLGDQQDDNINGPGSHCLAEVRDTKMSCVQPDNLDPLQRLRNAPRQAAKKLDALTLAAISAAEENISTDDESVAMEVEKSSKDKDLESEKSDEASERGGISSSSSDEEEANNEDKTPQSIARDSEDDDRISLNADLE